MVTDSGLYQLRSSCLLLEEPDLTNCSSMNDIALKYLSRCSELVRLKLGLCTYLSDIGLAHIAAVYVLEMMDQRLSQLDARSCNRITDRGMEYISYLGELSDLELCGPSNITSIGIKAVAFSCKRLADFDLKHCEKN